MSYRHIPNLYKDTRILEFRKVYALCKIHGTSSHISFHLPASGGDNPLKFFSGGEKYENFVKLFDQEALLKKFQESGVESATIYGEAYGGCFSYRTPVLLADGSTEEIGKIVNQKLTVEVKTYNFHTQKLENKRVIGWSKSPATEDEWITIHFKKRLRGGKSTKLVTTKNHIFFSKDKAGLPFEVLAETLKKGDTVFLPGEGLHVVQRQLILGSLLGDSSIRNGLVSIAHSKKQLPLFNEKLRILNSLISNVNDYISGFGSECIHAYTRCLPELHDIEAILWAGERKAITEDYLNKLHPIALAFWYMDDGNIQKNKNGFHRDACQLCTDGFTEEEVDLIVNFFNKKGYFCYKYFCREFPRVKFTPDGTVAFHLTISPFVIEEMKYKIIEEFRTIPYALKSINSFDFSEKNLIETTVDFVESKHPSKIKAHHTTKYDLSVEDNHCYFANKVLVHNSQQGMKDTYGPNLKFIAFEVQIGDSWLSVPQAEAFVKDLGLEFVYWELVSSDMESLNAQRDADSVQAIRNGMGPGHKREGVVLRPPFECTLNNGERLIAKHKRDDFRETKTPRVVGVPLEVMQDAQKAADEFVTHQRLGHILGRLQEEEKIIENTKKIIQLMVEDITREGSGEVLFSGEVTKAISKATARLYKTYLQNVSLVSR